MDRPVGVRAGLNARVPRLRHIVSALLALGLSAAIAMGAPLVAIDPGHGGADSGAVGALPIGTVTGLTPHADQYGSPQIFEKDVNLDVAQRLNGFLVARGFPTVMTRNTDNAGGDVPYTTEGADLKARTDLANAQGAALFVSIHQNSAPGAASGTETYVHTTAGAAPRALAAAIHQSVVARLLLTDRGVKDANFYVLRNSAMPAVLVEGAFISNPADALMLANPDVRQAMAEGIGQGILTYSGLLDAGAVQRPVAGKVTLVRAGAAVTQRAGINPRRGDLWVATVVDTAGAVMVGVPLVARLPNGKGVQVSTRGDGKALLAVPRRRGTLRVSVAVPGLKVTAMGAVPARTG
jgi:N-acetylmuramoyl-L-alanine amidase